MFEADFTDTCTKKVPLMLMGVRGVSRVRRHGSEDPHRREQKFD